MTQRVTEKDLENLARQLNELTGSPLTSWETVDGRNRANVGNFHISYAYGGACLHRMHNESGGVSCPLTNYHAPKRELYEKMHAYIDGIEFARRIAEGA